MVLPGSLQVLVFFFGCIDARHHLWRLGQENMSHAAAYYHAAGKYSLGLAEAHITAPVSQSVPRSGVCHLHNEEQPCSEMTKINWGCTCNMMPTMVTGVKGLMTAIDQDAGPEAIPMSERSDLKVKINAQRRYGDDWRTSQPLN